jgi:iron complex outermembrane recepter protein
MSKQAASWRWLSIALAIAGGDIAPSVWAASSLADDSGALEEIVVTAQKREEKAIDVPMSLSVVSGETLGKLGVTSVLDLALTVPSLGVYQVSPGQNNLEIRGISSFRGTGTLVGLYMDEVPLSAGLRLGDGSGLDVQTMDLSRVEILKGPQGTLFGEGGAGGVIRYVTNEPKLDTNEGRITATYFNTESGDPSAGVVGVVNVPIVNNVLAVRIAGTYESDGGWINNISSGENNFNSDHLFEVRTKVLFEPTEQLKVSALVDIHRLDAGGQNIVNVAPYDRSLFQQAVYPNYPTNGFFNNFDLYNLTLKYDFGFATLLSSTSYFDLNTSSGGGWQTQIIPGAGITPLGGLQLLEGWGKARQTVTSQELRLTSNIGGPLKWLVGSEFKSTFNNGFANDPTNIGTNELIPGNPPILIPGTPAEIGTALSNIAAGYADGSYTFFDRFEIGGGVRFFHEDQESISYQPNGETIAGVGGEDLSGTFQKVTYRVIAKYRLNENINLYANTGTGFRSGGFNDPADVQLGAPKTYKPENSKFYEVGVKGTFLDNRLNLDLAGFTGQYRDQIELTANVNPSTGAIYSYSANAGVADIKGGEWDLEISPITGLRLGFSGDVTHTNFTQIAPSSPVAVGDPIDFVPEYDFVLSGEYEFRWSTDLPGYVSVNSSWKGEMQNSNRNTGVGYVVYRTEPLNFVQASVGAKFKDFDFSFFGRNLTDERGILIAQFTGLTPQARPRSFGMSVSKSF